MSKEPWQKVQDAVDVVHLWPKGDVGLCGMKCGPAQEMPPEFSGWEVITCRVCLTLASDPSYVDYNGWVMGDGTASYAKEQLKRLDRRK
jgi:hypothetical protein